MKSLGIISSSPTPLRFTTLPFQSRTITTTTNASFIPKPISSRRPHLVMTSSASSSSTQADVSGGNDANIYQLIQAHQSILGDCYLKVKRVRKRYLKRSIFFLCDSGIGKRVQV
ncbi:hypothetical protein GIB67_023134 [Kingdonia uniflora]|uniref:Uncharacterized protein n=1 Tax=Kingdonia uniflora TaxID=39325 RepID=A0A7J7M5M1_9MAGN|nr:hypothetical protein GIB67_023134 [Kingdonia uniflora]